MIELTSAILFVYSSMSGPIDINNVATNTPTISIPAIVEASNTEIPNNAGLEKLVREYFGKERSLLIEIAKCESSFRQYNKEGEVLRGKVNKSDLGLLQVNEYYHGESSKKLGFDIYTVEGNLAYAKWLYDKEGAQPWISSSPCWGKTPSASAQVALVK